MLFINLILIVLIKALYIANIARNIKAKRLLTMFTNSCIKKT